MKKNLLLFVASILLLINSCSDNPLTDDDKPGRRDYNWTVDTLIIPEGRSYPSLMWGACADNIWAIGSAYANAYQIWHYDGYYWQNYIPAEYIDPRGIYGSNENNIWTSSLGTNIIPAAFWHYNGSEWSKFCDIIIDGYFHITIESIAGSAANNIYAVGFADSIDSQSYKGIILHFNGIEWKEVNIPIIKNSFDQIFYDETSGIFLISGWIFDKPDEYIYLLDGNNLIKIFSTQGGLALNSIDNTIYPSTLDGKLYKFMKGNIVLFKDFSTTNFAGSVRGRSEKDFFTINWDGIGHYNGTDLITIYKKWNDNWFPDGGIVFEKEVFFIWDDSYNTFIVHGKLKD
jgi:hypothetical protein